MEKIKTINYILGGLIKNDEVYKITLATYGDLESAKIKVNNLIENLALGDKISRSLKAYSYEIPREFVDKNLIGDLKIIITDMAKVRYDVAYNEGILNESIKALDYYENKKDVNMDLRINKLKNRISNTEINLEFENKLLSL